ncbi:unnamed protein product [Mesocestoides corti]|uniref:K Homology domain-containing protein n=2 Tax=Mesocestoides corti TaxID=53468 RepID=A0A3P6HDT3_MESCO|nr:unnamed protein product [Mesocestoides corti]
MNPTAVNQSPPDKCDLTEHGAANTSCDETSGGRLVTEVEHQSIEEFFNTFKPSAVARATSVSLEGSSRDGDAVGDDDPYLESILDRIKEQLMLKSATKEEVAVRRQQWRELAIKLQGVKHWEGFSQVFMVSSATGEGIDNLRNYLLERAKPGKQWLLSPALITDQEPSELIRMCVWAHCLDLLPQEVPYGLVITVDECERVRLASEGDDRIYVHARIRCPNERSIKNVIGPGGSTIRSIASAAKQELSSMFQAPTVVKLTAEAVRPSQKSMRRMRAAKDFAEVFPNFGVETRSPGLEVAEA